MSNALIIMLAVMGGTMLLRAPISFGMLAGGIAYLIAKGADVGLMAEQVLNGLYNSYVLLAVPLFILAASIMNAGAISERLFSMAIALVGHFRGGHGRPHLRGGPGHRIGSEIEFAHGSSRRVDPLLPRSRADGPRPGK